MGCVERRLQEQRQRWLSKRELLSVRVQRISPRRVPVRATKLDWMRSSRPQRRFETALMSGPTSFAKRACQMPVCDQTVIHETVYRNGLRGCHFGRVGVNLRKCDEVSYIETLSFSTECASKSILYVRTSGSARALNANPNWSSTPE